MARSPSHNEISPYVEVAVTLPVWGTFTYRVPPGLEGEVAVGKRVLVPFQKRTVTGYILSFPASAPKDLDPGKVRDLVDVLDEVPLIDETMLSFFSWISNYYVYPLGEVIKTGLPPGLTVESRRTLKITAEGRSRLIELPPASLDRRLLELCATRSGITLHTLSRRLKVDRLHSRILSLKKEGLLTEEIRLGKGETRAKLQSFVALAGGGEPAGKPPLTPKEAEILKFIESRKRVPREELREKFHRVSRHLKGLAHKGYITVRCEEVYRDPLQGEDFEPETAPELARDQQKALSEIERSISAGGFSPYLLHGVTGSGKTEVYLRAIERVLEAGRQAIVLVPEISLTPQLISRFKKRFRKGIALLHSGLSPGERYDQWRRILREEVSIAIGARSAVFAPFKRLGIVVVDEEHETSFKQEEKLKYNARDLAVIRAKMADALLILGSATPSIESFFNTIQTQKFRYLHLPRRIGSSVLPTVEIIDMRLERDDGGHPVLSRKLKEALLFNAGRGHQSLLFLNRRGFANFILCRECGWTDRCPNCSVTLTYHAVGRRLQCHHCGLARPAPGECPQCKGYSLYPLGIGTQRIENEILALLPSARIARMDRDTTTRKGAYHRIVQAMESRKIDILIGTQMIVKGHDFPNITLVGIICADTVLHFPDFRATERTFQLLTQAAGRAGRGEEAGRVIIQTFNPDHYGIQKAKDQDFLSFYQEEILHRQELGYPPFSRLANLRIHGHSLERTQAFAEHLGRVGARLIRKKRKFYGGHIDLLGPCSAPLSKVKGRHRWQLLVKSGRSERLHRFLNELVREAEGEAVGVRVEVDVDPINLM